jgi:hypothetical protein
MIYRKLRKLEQHKRDLQSLIIAAYESNADPDVVMIRVSDLNHDLYELEREIEIEGQMLKFKELLALFIGFCLVLIIVALFKNLL